MARAMRILLVLFFGLLAACGAPVESPLAALTDAAAPESAPPEPMETGSAPTVGTCSDRPPEGARTPAPLPKYSGGACPALRPGETNTIRSGGVDRKLILVAPADHDPKKEKLPLVFMWHHLGGAADSILKNAEVARHADALRFVAVMPEAKGDLTVSMFGKSIDWAWPYLAMHSDARLEEELRFFDDMLACVGEQLNVNTSCVSSAGVSAGALWTSQLAQRRAEHLASVVIMSGGVGPGASSFVDVRPWTGAKHAMPALVGWGGPTDACAANFDTAARNLEQKLAPGGHFVLECVHNCGHAAPPVDDPAVGVRVLFRFALDHPYWLSPGTSPWRSAMPEGTPSWCAVGAGNAKRRVGTCDGVKSCPVPAL